MGGNQSATADNENNGKKRNKNRQGKGKGGGLGKPPSEIPSALQKVEGLGGPQLEELVNKAKALVRAVEEASRFAGSNDQSL